MRFTIGRLMIAVAVAALGLGLLRLTGLRAGVLIGGWAGLSWLAWFSCSRSAEETRAWIASEAVGVALASTAVLGLNASWMGGFFLVGVLLFLIYPIHLGCGLGWLGAVRRANRTAPVPRSLGPALVFCLAPAPVIVGIFLAVDLVRG